MNGFRRWFRKMWKPCAPNCGVCNRDKIAKNKKMKELRKWPKIRE